MSSVEASSERAAESPNGGMADLKLEVVVVPVSDVDRVRSSYTKLGWRLDADLPLPGRYAAYMAAEQAGEGLPS